MNWSFSLPEITLTLASFIILIISVIQNNRNTFLVSTILCVMVCLITAILVIITPNGTAYNNVIIIDNFSKFMKILILISATLTCVISLDFNEKERLNQFEFPILILYSTLGAMVMVSSNNLITLFLGLELSSLAIYILCAFARTKLLSSEAGLKYFVLGSLASGILLYGCSLIYGFSGTLTYTGIYTALSSSVPQNHAIPLGSIIGIVFIIVGLCFKLGAVPFHMWAPDVYRGAPTPVASFLATVPKFAAFALIIRIMTGPFELVSDQWRLLISLIAMASMLFGGLAAITENNLKKLMAYSSIGHMGYGLTGLAVATPDGIRATLIYLTIYMVMTMGAFAILASLRREGHSLDEISHLAGLSKTNPAQAMMLAIFMFSLAGVPPLGGFFGKLLILEAALRAGLSLLTIIGVVASIMSVYFYLRIVRTMYFDSVRSRVDVPDKISSYVTWTAGFIMIFFMVFFEPIAVAAGIAADSLFCLYGL